MGVRRYGRSLRLVLLLVSPSSAWERSMSRCTDSIATHRLVVLFIGLAIGLLGFLSAPAASHDDALTAWANRALGQAEPGIRLQPEATKVNDHFDHTTISRGQTAATPC